MNEREFLKKIRNLQESGKKIGLTEMPIITEKKEKSVIQLLMENNIQTIEPDEQREEENKFKDIVSKLVKFNPIKVHTENVEWSGHLIRENIDWYFSLDDTIGCYIDTTELIQLRDETLEVLKKLRGYYDVWSDEWSNRLTGGSSEETSDMDMDMGGETTPEDMDMGAEEGDEDTGFGF
jgi:hypothetical protein